MIIFLRQDSIKIGTSNDHKLSVEKACFIRVKYAEIFDYGIEFLPLGAATYVHKKVRRRLLARADFGNNIRISFLIP